MVGAPVIVSRRGAPVAPAAGAPIPPAHGRRADPLSLERVRIMAIPGLELFTRGLYSDDSLLSAATEALGRRMGPRSDKGDGDPNQDPDPPMAPTPSIPHPDSKGHTRHDYGNPDSRAHEALWVAHGIALPRPQGRAGSVFGLIGPNGAGRPQPCGCCSTSSAPPPATSTCSANAPVRRAPIAPPDRLHPRRTQTRRPRQGRRATAAPRRDQRAGRTGAIEQLAERLDLNLTRPVRTLSKGNKQKLGLVQAFMHKPELLVLDERTSGLDPLVQREFLAMLREAQEAGQTVLLSSHVLSEIQQVADDVAVLARGKIVAEGAVSALRIASVRRVRATLTGSTADAVRAALTRCRRSGRPGCRRRARRSRAGLRNGAR